ncbi:MAG: hypothetical protein V3V13_01835 [Paracoccaceae bacterium]
MLESKLDGQLRMWHLWLMLAVTIGIGATLINISMQIAAHGGSKPFDIMIDGYTLEQFETNLAAWGDVGKRLYLMRMIPLDMVFPFIYGFTLLIAWGIFVGRKRPILYWSGTIITLAAVICDYAENMRIGMLLSDILPITQDNVATTSMLTMAKWGFFGLCISMLCIVLIHRFWTGKRN